ncbi:hypothetical protein G6715_05030 [Polynucleobacter paneuropaeus]|nr:hypothetical protein [Polynucleobacter paneuropaeus]
MAIETIGFITLNNITKTSEYILPITISLAGIFLGLLYRLFIADSRFNNQYLKHDFEVKVLFNESINALIIFSFISVCLSKFIAVNTLYISLILTIFFIYLNNKSGFKFYRVLVLGVLPSLLLINKIFSVTDSLSVIIIVIIIYALVLKYTSLQFYAFSCILFTFKYILVGDFVISDAFHSAEHFLASSKILYGLFSVFPNIGYLEEFPGYFISKALSKISDGNIQISIVTSRYLIVCGIIPILTWLIYKKDRLLALLFYFAVPTDRISLLIALLYSAFLVYYFLKERSNKLFILLTFFPILCLGLSPSYILMPLFALIIILNLPFKKYKYLISILLLWIILLILLRNEIFFYLYTYRDLSSLFDVGFSTSTTSLNFKDLFFWNIFLFCLVMIVASVTADSSGNLFSKIIKICFLTILLYKFISYGYGRIDPGFTRLLSLGVPLLYIASLSSSKYLVSIRVLLLVIVLSYINIGIPELNFKINKIPYNKKEEIIQLSANNKKIVESIITFSNGNEVINYSMEPALAHYLPGAKVPPFSSPYVTLGSKSQESVINFFKSNPESIIYIGHDFKTFDGIDIRVRAPLVYKFISENYNLVIDSGNIYAAPFKHGGKSSLNRDFFTDININKSALFFNKSSDNVNALYKEVIVDCTGPESNIYRINTKNNSLVGELSCGRNMIPSSFIWGEILSIDPL